jgi:hypothetical protein
MTAINVHPAKQSTAEGYWPRLPTNQVRDIFIMAINGEAIRSPVYDIFFKMFCMSGGYVVF